MAGITFESYRNFYSEHGAGILYTEMISDKGLIYDSKETFEYLPTTNSKRPLGIQLFGSSPDTIADAISIIEGTTDNYDFIDINMGCSVPKVYKSGSGASLLKNLDLAESIVKAAVKVSSKPITVKVRLGWSTNQISTIVKRLAKAGASMIAIHPRYAVQLFRDSPHWDLVKNIQKEVNIPIVVSGDIYTAEDALKALKITGASGVMVARGGIGNPMLCRNINNLFLGLPEEGISLQAQKELALKFIECVCNEKGEYVGVRILRGIVPKFFQQYPNSKKHRVLITQCITKDKLMKVINELE